MIQEKQIDPKSIMLVTFTAKSAKEMKERLATYPKDVRLTSSSNASWNFSTAFSYV